MEMEVHRGVQPNQPMDYKAHYISHHIPHYPYVKSEPSEGSSNGSENSGSPSKIMGSTSSPNHENHQNFGSQNSVSNPLNFGENPTQKSSPGKNMGALRNSGGRNNAIRLAADRKRPYPCMQCPSRFGSKMELEEHQNSHTGMKPFECDICKSRFNRRSTLWNHKRIHSEAKPFVCTVCQMQFKWKNSLKCHKEMHLRKNETTEGTDIDIKQLTYATAAKRKLAESSDVSGSSTISTANANVHGPLISSSGGRKRAKMAQNSTPNGANVIVQNQQRSHQNLRQGSGTSTTSPTSSNLSISTSMAQNHAGHGGAHGHQQGHEQHQSFHSPMGHGLHATDLLGHHQHPGHSNNLDLDTNLDFLSNFNANALMQSICSGDMEHQLGQLDFGRSQNHGSLFFPTSEDQSKMLSSHFLGDIKPDDLQTNSLTAQMNSAAPSLNMSFPLLNSVIDMRLQQFNLGSERGQNQLDPQQLNSDYTNTMLNAQAQNSLNASNFHIPPSVALNTAHLTNDMLYQQPLDPALLLNTASHGADYLSNIDYMVNHNTYASHPALVHNDLTLPSATDAIPSPIPVHPQPQHHQYPSGQPLAAPTATSQAGVSLSGGNHGGGNEARPQFDLKNALQKAVPIDRW